MEITISQRQIDEIVYKVSLRVAKIMKNHEAPEMVTLKEAAAIKGVSVKWMRQIKDRYPHTKNDGNNGKIMFERKALLER